MNQLVDSNLAKLLNSQNMEANLPLFKLLETRIKRMGFEIIDRDTRKPWGAYFRIADSQKDRFCKVFFKGVDLPQFALNLSISPKILLVAPKNRLSWQRHYRRAEFWRVIYGPIGVVRSDTDEQPLELEVFSESETIDLPSGTRHRLVGLGTWGLVAEFWIHTDPQNPSDESDIVRIEDDFSR